MNTLLTNLLAYTPGPGGIGVDVDKDLPTLMFFVYLFVWAVLWLFVIAYLVFAIGLTALPLLPGFSEYKGKFLKVELFSSGLIMLMIFGTFIYYYFADMPKEPQTTTAAQSYLAVSISFILFGFTFFAAILRAFQIPSFLILFGWLLFIADYFKIFK
jgi:hypothetical protein